MTPKDAIQILMALRSANTEQAALLYNEFDGSRPLADELSTTNPGFNLRDFQAAGKRRQAIEDTQGAIASCKRHRNALFNADSVLPNSSSSNNGRLQLATTFFYILLRCSLPRPISCKIHNGAVRSREYKAIFNLPECHNGVLRPSPATCHRRIYSTIKSITR